MLLCYAKPRILILRYGIWRTWWSTPVVLKVGHMPPPPMGPHQVFKVPQENDGKLVDQSNFTAWIKYFKFTTESKVPFSPASHTAQKAKLHFIAFPKYSLVGSGFRWATYLLSKVPNHLEVVRRSLLITDHNATGDWKTCKWSSGPRDTLNIMPIINRIYLLTYVNNVLYLNKIFKKNTIFKVTKIHSNI